MVFFSVPADICLICLAVSELRILFRYLSCAHLLKECGSSVFVTVMAPCSPLRADHESLDNPCGLAIFGSRLYVSDTGQHRICVLEDGNLRVHAGSGQRGSQNGSASEASFAHPCGIAVDEVGNLFVADCGNHTIRMVTPEGVVSTLAGSGESGLKDGLGTGASFANPCGLAISNDSDTLELYVTDYSNNAVRKIRRISPDHFQVSTAAVGGALDTPYGIACGPVGEGGSVLVYVGCHNSSNLVSFSSPGGAPTVFAGCGRPGHVDGKGAAAAFNRPNGVAMDADGAVYVTDSGNHCVRHVTPDGVVCTLQSAHGAPSSVIVCDVGGRAALDGAACAAGEAVEKEAGGAEVRLLVAARADCCVRMLPVAAYGADSTLPSAGGAGGAGGHFGLVRRASRGQLLNLARLLGRAEALGPEEAEARQQAAAPPGAAARRRCMPAACSFAKAVAEQERQSTQRQTQDDCVICLSPFDDEQDVRLLRCSHIFHAACIDEWLERSNSCPCCKADCRRVA